MALRFGNSIFEPLWRRGKIRDVQITLAEKIGVEGRGEFYNATGALRDMVQNHLMQLLCIVAMEPPISMDADNVRDEKLKVIRSLEPYTAATVASDTVRGQYHAGEVDGETVPGYLQEDGIGDDSRTETFVALKAQINNWRWSGVPFYLRTGKRMHEHVSEVVINFYSLPHAIYPAVEDCESVNRLYIRLQPHESVVRGNQTLFVRRDELNAAWKWVEPIMNAWDSSDSAPEAYAAGSSGPASAAELIDPTSVGWIEEC